MNEFNNSPKKDSLEEITTNKITQIENLFEGFDGAKNSNSLLDELNEFEKTGPIYVSKEPSPQKEEAKITNPNSLVDSLDLDGLKELREQIAALQKQAQQEESNENAGLERGRAKKLTTSHYKEGVHYDGFSNGDMKGTFLSCSVLGFITLFMSGGWFFYIIDHIL